MRAPVPVALREERTFEVDPATRAPTSGNASQAEAIVLNPWSMCSTGAVIRVGQSRAVPRPACAGRSRPPDPRSGPGWRTSVPSDRWSECPRTPARPNHRPDGSTGPSTGRASAIRSPRIANSSHRESRKCRAVMTIGGISGADDSAFNSRLPGSPPRPRARPARLALTECGGDELAEQRVRLRSAST